MALNALIDSFLPQSDKKCGTERVNSRRSFLSRRSATATKRLSLFHVLNRFAPPSTLRLSATVLDQSLALCVHLASQSAKARSRLSPPFTITAASGKLSISVRGYEPHVKLCDSPTPHVSPDRFWSRRRAVTTVYNFTFDWNGRMVPHVVGIFTKLEYS